MDRREFATLLPALLATTALLPDMADAQQANAPASPARGELPTIVSGVYPPGKGHGSNGHESFSFLAGMLTAGNIRLEMHESVQQPGAVHEPVGKHLHSEIWLVKEGVCELMTNGVTRTMKAGDVGICCAGDLHYIKNAGDTQCAYFVVTVGPPEPVQS
jgi:mannose-6-phosphate isomerase-like protein (cupin superfamily)